MIPLVSLTQWGPRRGDNLALVSLDENPYNAVWRVRVLQLFGGRRWMFGIMIYSTKPRLTLREIPEKEDEE